jgi:hypothetical protein
MIVVEVISTDDDDDDDNDKCNKGVIKQRHWIEQES